MHKMFIVSFCSQRHSCGTLCFIPDNYLDQPITNDKIL